MVEVGDKIHLKHKEGVYKVVLIVMSSFIWVKGENGSPQCVRKKDIHSVQGRLV